MRNELAFFLVCALVSGCGSVTASQLTAADAGGDAALEAAVAEVVLEAPAVAGELGQVDAGAPELAPEGPPACPMAIGTSTAQRCKDLDGVRCATGCIGREEAGSRVQPGPDAGACIEPGPPWTGGIPVLCVNDCADCPAN